MKEFRPAKKRVEVSVGESVSILRELQDGKFHLPVRHYPVLKQDATQARRLLVSR